MLSVLLISLTVSGGWAAPTSQQCWSDGNGQNARYWDNGVEITRGQYYYKCVFGELRAGGCLDANKQKVPIGGTFVNNGFEFRCIRTSDGYASLESIACVMNDGVKHVAGETWDHPVASPYWYECQRMFANGRNYLAVVTRGCLVEKRRIDINQVFEWGQGWWECQNRTNGTTLCLKGCLHNNVRLHLNEQVKEGDFTYKCHNAGGTPEMRCDGCLDRNQRLVSPGDRYFDDHGVYQCEVVYNPDPTQMIQEHKLVGCVEKNRRGEAVGEVVLGGTWLQKDDPSCTYEYQCTDEGKIENVGCTLSKDGFDYLFVPVNSYTIYNYNNGVSKGIGCKTNVDNHLEYFEFNVDEVGKYAGELSWAAPRGK